MGYLQEKQKRQNPNTSHHGSVLDSGVKRSGLTLDMQEDLRFASGTVRREVICAGVPPHPREPRVPTSWASDEPPAIYIKFTILRRNSQGLSPLFLAMVTNKS